MPFCGMDRFLCDGFPGTGSSVTGYDYRRGYPRMRGYPRIVRGHPRYDNRRGYPPIAVARGYPRLPANRTRLAAMLFSLQRNTSLFLFVVNVITSNVSIRSQLCSGLLVFSPRRLRRDGGGGCESEGHLREQHGRPPAGLGVAEFPAR